MDELGMGGNFLILGALPCPSEKNSSKANKVRTALLTARYQILFIYLIDVLLTTQ